MNLAIAAQPMKFRRRAFQSHQLTHAGPDAAARHEGDMGNVEADASGNAKLDYVDHQISLANDEKSAIGRAVVVHAKPDDLKTQPSGDAGGRIACGVIGWAKSQ